MRQIKPTAVVPAIAAGVLLLPWAIVLGAPPKDSLNRDYGRDLPRIKPVAADQAVGTIDVAAGFRLELVASEPLVVDPVAMAFDSAGRLYVAEMRGYSERGDAQAGQIRRLVDTDGDGIFDQATVYVPGLSWPTAVCCWDGGIFVGAAPDIWYCKDTTNDGKADLRRRIFTGFGRSNVQGLFNTFLWGPDNRIHGATSSSGAVVRQVSDYNGDAAESTARPIKLSGRNFAFDPRSLVMTPESGGGQHGMSFDDWGNLFVCSNSDHLQQVMYEDRYLARNPYVKARGARISIAADGPQAAVYRRSPVEPWRIIRTRLRAKKIVPGIVEGGGRPAGYFTGATGVTIYRGSAAPALAGCAIVGDVGSNLVHRKRLDREGLQFTGRRIDTESELAAASDIWFRPAQFANGPEGALYIADMYREVIEHPKSLPPLIKKHLDLNSGNDRGRIYRLVGKAYQQPPAPQMDRATSAELVTSLSSRDAWRRETAARLLYQRQDRASVPPLRAVVLNGAEPTARIAALHALDGLGALDRDVLLSGLQDTNAWVRKHAVRLCEPRHVRIATAVPALSEARPAAFDDPAIVERLLQMDDDDDLRVRYQLAFTLGELEGPRAKQALAQLAARDADNVWIRQAVLSSLRVGAGDVLAVLAQDKTFRQEPKGRQFIHQLAAQIGRQRQAADFVAIGKLLPELHRADPAVATGLVAALALPADDPLVRQLTANGQGDFAQVHARLVETAQRTAQDKQAKLAERIAAVQRLGLGSWQQVEPTCATLLGPEQPPAIQRAVVQSLARRDQPAVASLLLARWPQFSPTLRSLAVDVLLSREAWTLELLSAAQEERIGVGELAADRLRLLQLSRNRAIRQQAKRLLARFATSPRAEIIRRYQSALEQPGNAARGKDLFKRECSACHRIESVGFPLAPNLASMQNRGAAAILVNVLDPNREVNPKYVNYLAVTTDGRSISGMLTAETASSITLSRGKDQQETVLRIDIDELRSTGTSLMPVGFEKQISPAAMADLIAYLLSLE